MVRPKGLLSKALVTSAAGCILTSGLSRERQAKSPPGNCLASLIYQAMAPCETSTNKVAPVQGHALTEPGSSVSGRFVFFCFPVWAWAKIVCISSDGETVIEV